MNSNMEPQRVFLLLVLAISCSRECGSDTGTDTMVVREGRPAFIDCPFNNTYYVWRINNTVYGVSNLPPPYEASLALDGLNFTAERSINGTAIQCLTSLRSGSLEIAESTQVILIVEPVAGYIPLVIETATIKIALDIRQVLFGPRMKYLVWREEGNNNCEDPIYTWQALLPELINSCEDIFLVHQFEPTNNTKITIAAENFADSDETLLSFEIQTNSSSGTLCNEKPRRRYQIYPDETTTPAYTTPGGDIFLQVPPVLDNTALYSVWPYGPTEKKDCYCTLLGFEECPCVNKTAYTVELIKDTESNGQYTYTLHLNNLTNRLNDTRLFFFYESQATSCDGTYIALTQRFESTVRIIIGEPPDLPVLMLNETEQLLCFNASAESHVPVKGYQVQITDITQEEYFERNISVSSTKCIALPSFIPVCAPFKISVMAYNAVGYSVPANVSVGDNGDVCLCVQDKVMIKGKSSPSATSSTVDINCTERTTQSSNITAQAYSFDNPDYRKNMTFLCKPDVMLKFDELMRSTSYNISFIWISPESEVICYLNATEMFTTNKFFKWEEALIGVAAFLPILVSTIIVVCICCCKKKCTCASGDYTVNESKPQTEPTTKSAPSKPKSNAEDADDNESQGTS